jgi:glycerol-3-phosphate dehydrogenase
MRGEVLDVLVIGGGVTGAGAALDAATRGLSVGLVEARDYAAGTSSRSSKLIHGGLRYLEQLNFALVREALRERTLLLTRLCPHLVEPVPFLFPLTHPVWERGYVGAGIALYDAMAAPERRPGCRGTATCPAAGPCGWPPPCARRARRRDPVPRRAGRRRPAHDAVARTAAPTAPRSRRAPGSSASCARASASSARSCATSRRAPTSTCAPGRSSTPPASGPTTSRAWSAAAASGCARRRASTSSSRGTASTPTRGSSCAPRRASCSSSRGRGRHWIIGTTDTDWDLDKAHPAASRADIDYLLDRVNGCCARRWARRRRGGLRRPAAAAAGESEATSKLSREHAVSPARGRARHRRRRQVHDVPGHGRRRRRRGRARAWTAEGPAVGDRRDPTARGRGLRGGVEPAGAPRRAPGLHVARIEHLLRRYGRASTELLDLVAADPRARRAHPRRRGLPRSSRRATPRRTRARCTSTTSSPGARASPSRPGTGASPPRSRSPTSWARCSAGTRRRGSARSPTTSPGWRRSGSRSASGTTRRPTPPARCPGTCDGMGQPAVQRSGALGDGVPAEVLDARARPARPMAPGALRVGVSVDRGREVAGEGPGRRGSRTRRRPGSNGTSSPVSPSTTISGIPPTAEATTAVSQAIASTLTRPNGS